VSLRRFHLFEFEDQPWFPDTLRRAMTSYLVVSYRLAPLAKIWADHLAKVLLDVGCGEIVDLGSGSAGPMTEIVAELKRRGLDVSVTLTDLFPSQNGNSGGCIRYWPEAVDATNVPAALSGTRTMFSAFHHFCPEAAHRILKDAFDKRRAICIFEATSRTPAGIASMFLVPILTLFVTPMIRPVSWVQLLFTYVIPILPFLIFWDGFVSQLRSYTVEEFAGLTQTLQAPDYEWEIGSIRVSRLPTGVPYLIGRPAASS
jgi:hypothetical protein